MPKPEAFPTGTPMWADLFTSDPDRAESFYGELFGWKYEAPNAEFGGYINVTKDGQKVAGMMKNDGAQGTPDAWSIYLSTPDAAATQKAVESHGGQVVVPPMPVGDLGNMAVYIDPAGAAIGAWQPGTHTGFDVIAEHGAPGWFELHTRDYDGAVAFYTEVFGWDAHPVADMPDFRYTTYGEGEAQRAGIMDAAAFLPEGVGGVWTLYIQVDDPDAVVAKATELGGSVIDPPVDTPYGRMCTLADPTGAVFKLNRP